MNSLIKSLALVFFLTISSQALTQNVEFTRDYFPDDRQGLREAIRNARTGDKYFQMGGGKYEKALEYYLKAHNFNPDNALLNYRIGVCYLNSIYHERAIDFFEEAIRLNVPELDVFYNLGRALHLNYRFEEAIENYTYYRRRLTPEEITKKRHIIDRRIQECENGMKLVEEPVRVFIDNLGSRINSEYDDYSPIINADGTKMFFTTRRPIGNRPRKDRNDHKYYESILETRMIRGEWMPAKEPQRRIQSRSHNAAAGLSHDGETLLIYRGARGGDIYKTTYDSEKDRWSRARGISRTINSEYHESSATLSQDGRTLYFVSDRPGGYGGTDIWYSKLGENGRWSEPVNIGPEINTEYNEASVYKHSDGKTLYFSSQGHNSMGGYDIFKTQYIGGRWTEPENLGYPINTPDDNLHFTLTEEGEIGYYATFKKEGHGGSDIYKVTFLGPEKPLINTPKEILIASLVDPIDDIIMAGEVEIEVEPITILRGIIKDDETEDPVFATIRLYDNKEDKLLAEFNSHPETGEYLISLPGGKNYGISVDADDYLFHSENINIVESTVDREIINNIRLKRVQVGVSIVLNNIFFDTGKSTLRPESYAELGVLYQMLVENPSLKIKISGHTDDRGGWDLNKRLSEDRARAVVEFLIGRGIDRDRLQYEGYAYSKPIASNETAEGRQKNRRTEFEIIEN